MASKALMSSASPVVSNRAHPSSPSSVGFGPSNVSFSFTPSPLRNPPSSRLSLVVRAQQHQGAGQLGANPSPVPAHSAWNTTEDERWFKMRLDMPGVVAEDIDVKVEGDILVIKDLARMLHSPYDTKLQLPPYCVKQNATATLENGVLHVSVPKFMTIPPPPPTVVHVPVRRAPIM